MAELRNSVQFWMSNIDFSDKALEGKPWVFFHPLTSVSVGCISIPPSYSQPLQSF